MKYRLVALPLLAILGNPAAAAEPGEHKLENVRAVGAAPIIAEAPAPKKRHSKNALRVIATLASVGIRNPEVRNLISTVDSRIDNGYFRFTEQQLPMNGGKVTLRYRLSGSVDPILSSTNKHGVRRLELSYKPSENSRWEAVATRKYVVVNYRVPLDKIEW